MSYEFKRDWDGKEWERFSLRLVQVRHGAQNVQTVPDNVRGDAGIEFLTTDGCCYQCYAPAQSADTAKATSAIKAKATRDLKKLTSNQQTVQALLGDRRITRWILLCPFLDDKSVISHVQAKTKKFSIPELGFVSEDFHVLVQSQTDFESELTTLRVRSQGIPIDMQIPSSEEVSLLFSRFGIRIDEKLKRGFPKMHVDLRNKRVRENIRAHLLCAETLEKLKEEFPDLWETYRRTLSVEELRLQSVGSGTGEASDQLVRQMERLEAKLSDALPSLHNATITSLATGTLSTWLMSARLILKESMADDRLHWEDASTCILFQAEVCPRRSANFMAFVDDVTGAELL